MKKHVLSSSNNLLLKKWDIKNFSDSWLPTSGSLKRKRKERSPVITRPKPGDKLRMGSVAIVKFVSVHEQWKR